MQCHVWQPMHVRQSTYVIFYYNSVVNLSYEKQYKQLKSSLKNFTDLRKINTTIYCGNTVIV